MKQSKNVTNDWCEFSDADVDYVCHLFASTIPHFACRIDDPDAQAYCDRLQNCARFLILALRDVGLDVIFKAYQSNHPDTLLPVEY